MIKFKLDEILKIEKLSQNQFSKICDVRPNTINSICKNNIRRLEINTLEKVIKTLNKMGYKVDDLISFEEI